MAPEPNTDAEHWSTALFGPKLLTDPKTSVPTASAFHGKKLVALYFSASWCPPCRSFSPKLIEFYKSVNDDVEIIFVSSDRDEASFSAYFGKFPWLAMVPGFTGREDNDRHATLAAMLKVQGIPSVIVLDAGTSNFVTDNARNEIMEADGHAESGKARKALVRSWLSREAVPIDQAVFGGNVSPLMKVVQIILRRPIVLFGVMYILNQCLRHLAGLMRGKGNAGGQQEL